MTANRRRVSRVRFDAGIRAGAAHPAKVHMLRVADGQQGRQQDQEEPHLTQSAAQVTTLEKFCRHSPAGFPGARAGIARIARIAGIAGIGGGNGYRG